MNEYFFKEREGFMKEDVLQQFIYSHPDIRAVGIEGSIATGRQDLYSDLDVTLFTTHLPNYLEQSSWLDSFGPRIIMQTPEPIQLENDFVLYPFLMLFEDGSRINLKMASVYAFEAYLNWESTVQIVMDLDHRLQVQPIPNEQSFIIQKPSEQDFFECTNEFFWVATYVAKGILRHQFMYAAKHLEIIREELLRMIAWSISELHLERVNLGNAYKYLHEYMDEQDFEELRTTYAISSSTAQKDALQTMITLFERYAKPLAESYNYNYSEECEATKQYILNILEQRGIGMKSK